MEDVNEKNIEYGVRDLKFLGFPETVQESLKGELLNPDKAEKFSLKHVATYNRAEGGKDQVDYTITFNKSSTSDRYFLNNYTAVLKNESDPGQTRAQMFYINKGEGVTAKEAYNLLSGRAVHKTKLHNRENEEYKAWIQLDFTGKEPNGNFKQKQFHENYGYNLPAVLANYPIRELSDETQKKELIQSLEKGNVRAVTFARESGTEEKVYIVANPRFKNLLVYDASMKPKSLGVERKEQEPDQKKEKKEKVQQENDDDESGGKKKTRKRMRA